MNHDKLGKVEKDGIIQVLSRTADKIWLQISCDYIQGWTLASSVDIITDRVLYTKYDKSYQSTQPIL